MPNSLESWVDFSIPGIFEYISKAQSEKRFIIAGYASFDTVDQQKERILLEALGEAFVKMMSVVERRNLMFHHSNLQIGRILTEYKDTNNVLWKSGLDDNGLFIVAEIFTDTVKGKEIAKLMSQGRYLAFSIGGIALERKTSCDANMCWRDITKLDLYEVTSCERGVNQNAKGFLLDNPFTNISKMGENNDIFISNNEIITGVGSLLSEKNDMIEKSDLQKVLDAVAELTKIVKEDAVVETKPESLTKDDVMAMINTAIASVLENTKAKETEVKEPAKVTYYYKAPVEKDFAKPEEFTAAQKEYDAFVLTIKESLKPTDGVLVKKGIETGDEDKTGMTFQKLWESADGLDFDSVLAKAGVQ